MLFCGSPVVLGLEIVELFLYSVDAFCYCEFKGRSLWGLE